VERDTIADSIIDWVDKDHSHLLNGAEDDYYESLEDPYECRDGNFVVTEELLLVNGVTEEIYYGKKPSSEEGDEFEEKANTYSAGGEEWGNLEGERGVTQGLSEIFTVFSSKTSLKVNINDAPYGLLMSVPGMTGEVAQRIIELRHEEEFENTNDVRLKTLPNYNQIAPNITVDPTNFYRIEACGRVADSSVKRTITAVIELTLKKRDKYAVVYWQEGV
jgi:general secretion pathway protein K